jgi:hypothetical protein
VGQDRTESPLAATAAPAGAPTAKTSWEPQQPARAEFAPPQLEQEFEVNRDNAQSQNEDQGKIGQP